MRPRWETPVCHLEGAAAVAGKLGKLAGRPDQVTHARDVSCSVRVGAYPSDAMRSRVLIEMLAGASGGGLHDSPTAPRPCGAVCKSGGADSNASADAV
jgi:hypothetical protein